MFDAKIPRWVTAEASTFSRPEELAILDRVLAAPTDLRGVIFKGLEKRSVQWSVNTGKLAVLVWSIKKGLRPPRGEELLSPGRKAQLANRLEWAAKEFAASWRAVVDTASDSPKGFHLGSMAVNELLTAIEPQATKRKGRQPGDDATCYVERQLLQEVILRVDVIANAIAEDADSWGRTKPLLDKPNHKNAKRLWFIRYVSESFLHHFGEPMREEVVALAKIWFGDSALTANTVSEIARVQDLPHRVPGVRRKVASGTRRARVKKLAPPIKP